MHIFAGELGCDMKEDDSVHKVFSMFKDKWVLFRKDIKEVKEDEFLFTKLMERSCLGFDPTK